MLSIRISTSMPSRDTSSRRTHSVETGGFVRDKKVVKDARQSPDNACLSGANSHTHKSQRVFLRRPTKGTKTTNKNEVTKSPRSKLRKMGEGRSAKVDKRGEMSSRRTKGGKEVKRRRDVLAQPSFSSASADLGWPKGQQRGAATRGQGQPYSALRYTGASLLEQVLRAAMIMQTKTCTYSSRGTVALPHTLPRLAFSTVV